jgi:Flp pilus assembly protein TadD
MIPADSAARYNLGQVLQKTGHAREAAIELRAAEKINQKAKDAILAKTYNNTGTKLLQGGQLEEAVSKLREAVRLDPENAVARYNYGVALIETNKLEPAIAELEAALRLKPDQADAYYYLGRAWLARGRPAEAVQHLQTALGLNPRDARAYNVQAVALAAMRRMQEAIEQIRRALEIEPGNALFRENLGCLDRRLEGCTLTP